MHAYSLLHGPQKWVGVSGMCPHACMRVNEYIGVSTLLWISEIAFPSASD